MLSDLDKATKGKVKMGKIEANFEDNDAYKDALKELEEKAQRLYL